jgi:hypothetical protein
MEVDENAFKGDWSIGIHVYKHICNILPLGCSILEFGSGQGSSELGKRWNIQCVEHDARFLNMYPNIDYIYGPIVNGWYDHNIIESIDPNFDLLLIDGPPGFIGRKGILEFIDRLDVRNVSIIIDDTNRKDEQELYITLAEKLGRSMISVQDGNKQFGVLY